MKRPLTDHEYQINGGAWIGCTLSNTTNNGDGTYTITDGLGVSIPIGSLKVRVKALSINPASTALQNTAAFNASGGTDIPLFYMNQVKTMAIGDADQLLGYVSSSAGAVTFISSDTSKATIVVTGGNSYLHAVASGDVTVTANQAADGSYTTATDDCLATVVTATTVDDITYSTVALGKAATADGSSFNVPDSTTYTVRKYLMVSGKAVYQKTIPSTVLTTAKAVKEIIYNEDLGVMPASPTMDADGIYALFHCNKFKNIGDSTTLDNNAAQYLKWYIASEAGTLIQTKLTDWVYQFDWNNAFGSGYAAGVYLKKLVRPAGVWTVAFECRLQPGDSGKSIFVGGQLDGGGTSYVEWPLTDTDQTITLTYENNSDTVANDYNCIITAARDQTGSSTAVLSVILSNLRFTPGTTAGAVSAVIRNPTMNVGYDFISKGVKSDASFVIKDAISFGGGGLVHYDTSVIPIPAISVMFAMNIPSVSPGGHNVMLAYEDTSTLYYFETDDRIVSPNNWFNQLIQRSYKFFRDQWFILTITSDGQYVDAFINGYKIMRTDRGSVAGSTNYPRMGILGDLTNEFATYGKFAGMTYWRTKLSDADVVTAASIMQSRMRLKNQFVDDSPYFYISEGDSNTWQVGSYARLLRDDYTPQIFGNSPAESGAVLGIPGDVLAANSVFGRQSWVNATITDAIAKGKKVVMTILIGTNDMGARVNSSAAATAYYNSLCAYVATARALGAKVAMCTILDINNVGFMPEANRPYLNELNGLIRSDTTKYDGLIDFNADPAFSTATTTYYNSDLVHLNTTGYSKAHDIAKPVFDFLITL